MNTAPLVLTEAEVEATKDVEAAFSALGPNWKRVHAVAAGRLIAKERVEVVQLRARVKELESRDTFAAIYRRCEAAAFVSADPFSELHPCHFCGYTGAPWTTHSTECLYPTPTGSTPRSE